MVQLLIWKKKKKKKKKKPTKLNGKAAIDMIHEEMNFKIPITTFLLSRGMLYLRHFSFLWVSWMPLTHAKAWLERPFEEKLTRENLNRGTEGGKTILNI